MNLDGYVWFWMRTHSTNSCILKNLVIRSQTWTLLIIRDSQCKSRWYRSIRKVLANQNHPGTNNPSRVSNKLQIQEIIDEKPLNLINIRPVIPGLTKWTMVKKLIQCKASQRFHRHHWVKEWRILALLKVVSKGALKVQCARNIETRQMASGRISLGLMRNSKIITMHQT